MKWNFDGAAPIYAQLTAGLKLAIASGELSPGQRLRGVRDLAVEAGVNPNTMQRALSELEREGLVYAERTAGRYVTEDAAAVAAVRQELAASRTADYLSYMSRLGLTQADIISLIEKEEKHDNTGM